MASLTGVIGLYFGRWKMNIRRYLVTFETGKTETVSASCEKDAILPKQSRLGKAINTWWSQLLNKSVTAHTLIFCFVEVRVRLFRCLLILFNHITTRLFYPYEITDYILEDELKAV